MSLTTGALALATNEQLLTSISHRDERALAELYGRLGRAAYGIALRVVRDRTLAEDAVQEGFLTVWRAAGRFAPDRSAETWILTLVHRRAVDLVRREERARRSSTACVILDLGVEQPDERIDSPDRTRAVRAAVDVLPARQRRAIELAYYGGYTVTEIAERLDEPPGPIKRRLSAALGRLALLLDEDGESRTRVRTLAG